MKTGINLGIDSPMWDYMGEIKPDYAEIHVSSFINKTDGDFEDAFERIKKTAVPVTCANALFMSTLKLTGDDITSKDEIKQYLETVFLRTSKLGVNLIVFGSGTARKYGEDFGYKKAEEQVMDALNTVGNVAEKYGVRIAIEPLNHYETNMITSVKEGAEFCRKLNNPNVKLLADSYHMLVEGEEFSTLGDYKDVLIHSHIACGIKGNKEIREIPESSDKYGMRKFVNAVKNIDGIENLTIEAWTVGLTDVDKIAANWAEGVKAVKSWIAE